MAMEWEREGNLLAERFKREEVPGFLKKEFIANDDEFVVVERGGEIYRERGPGKFSISGFVGDLTDILLVDKSEKTLECEIKNVWFADEKKIDIKFSVKFRIFHSDHFSKNLMGERKKFSLRDLQNEIFSDIMYKAVLPELQKNKAIEFIKEDFSNKAKENMKSYMEKKFKEWGLILSSLSVDFEIPEGIKAEETAPKEEKPEEIDKGKTDEESKDEEREKLEKELEELKRSKEIAEKKFYNKELPEEAFRRMMEDFERKIIEIETKLKES